MYTSMTFGSLVQSLRGTELSQLGTVIPASEIGVRKMTSSAMASSEIVTKASALLGDLLTRRSVCAVLPAGSCAPTKE